jgi:hypothetical protein
MMQPAMFVQEASRALASTADSRNTECDDQQHDRHLKLATKDLEHLHLGSPSSYHPPSSINTAHTTAAAVSDADLDVRIQESPGSAKRMLLPQAVFQEPSSIQESLDRMAVSPKGEAAMAAAARAAEAAQDIGMGGIPDPPDVPSKPPNLQPLQS